MVARTLALAAAVATAAASDIIPNEYIVTFRPNADFSRKESVMTMHNKEDIMNVYSIGSFNAYTFKGDNNMRLMLEENDQVLSVEPNQVMRAFQTGTCRNEAARSWGLERMGQRNRLDQNTGSFNSKPVKSVTNYILDTGINMNHEIFVNSAKDKGADCSGFFGGCTEGAASNANDRQGHGTHVAGTVAGNVYGLARDGDVVPVKVLGDNGSGSTNGVIGGVQWAVSDCLKGNKRCVANMSLGGGFSQALNNAVDAAVEAGIVMVVAAGNENQNACNVSPASASKVITVGSTDQRDNRSSFSNFGNCVDIFAPGSAITSAWWNSNTATQTISGTSMASPHVAGLASIILEENSTLTPAQVLQRMEEDATAGVINNVGNGSPNLLAFNPCA